ncbi:MAG: IPTL-CTERM sorting domain-containing protein [Candidatus Thiodiazotropha sp. 6PLUC2]
MTFVLDNGGTTANSQTWNITDLQCAHWSMNDAGNVRFEHDLSGAGEIAEFLGAVETDAGGALIDNFSRVIADPATPAAYTAIGFTPPDPIGWYANSSNGIFYSPTYVNHFDDLAGGVLMAIGNWSNPIPYAGVGCALPVVEPMSVPTLTEWGMILMTGLLGICALFAIRRCSD